jgi:hypothetical protein
MRKNGGCAIAGAVQRQVKTPVGGGVAKILINLLFGQ